MYLQLPEEEFLVQNHRHMLWSHKINGGAGNENRHIFISAEQLAIFGQLFLNQGRWKGKEILPESWIHSISTAQVNPQIPVYFPALSGPGYYSFNWWTNGQGPSGDRNFPGAPENLFSARGHNNNNCFIIPEWDMVIVRLGTDGGGDGSAWNTFFKMPHTHRQTPLPAARYEQSHDAPAPSEDLTPPPQLPPRQR